METNPVCAYWSVTLVLIEYENFWLMSKNLMVAHMIGIVLLILFIETTT